LKNGDRQAWGFSLFCDDIRAEAGAKISVMGIYQTDMIFPSTASFPLVLPKFCALIKYYELAGVFQDDISLHIFFPGDARDTPTVTIPFQRSLLSNDSPAPYPLEDDQERIFNLTFPLMLSPCQIKQEGFVKVRAVAGSITTRLGSLMIRRALTEENGLLFPFQPGPSPIVPANPAPNG
jgi:hypothetical protein